jgi:CHAD domain-containing protein
VADRLDATRQRLDAARGIDPPEDLHQARIEGKRLRYLLEAARDVDADVPAILGHLKGLQDRLGEFHDAFVLSEMAGRALIDAARGRAEAAVEAAAGGKDEPSRRIPWALLELVELGRRRQWTAWRKVSRGRAQREEVFREIEAKVAEWRELGTVTDSPEFLLRNR